MPTSPTFLIIADDLTGAADTAARCRAAMDKWTGVAG